MEEYQDTHQSRNIYRALFNAGKESPVRGLLLSSSSDVRLDIIDKIDMSARMSLHKRYREDELPHKS
jgi:hypothetical protein